MKAVAIFLIGFNVFVSGVPFASAANTVTRRDGFLLIWSSLRRSIDGCGGRSFADVPEGQRGEAELTFARCRKLFDDVGDMFRPDTPLTLEDALLWLFRTRNVEVEKGKDIDRTTLPSLLQRYTIVSLPKKGEEDKYAKIYPTEDQLLTLMRNLDTLLRNEVHEASLYAEDFQGEGTASGEKFDMYALTAAHRTFPFDTLVNVTNVENGKSVVVRINDRGPYVKGRDLDLSLASFTAIADREEGKIHVTMERMGDASVVGPCTRRSVFETSIAGNVRLHPGLPHALALGDTYSLSAPSAFVVRSVTYPDGTVSWPEDWVLPGESFSLKPSIVGRYALRIETKEGRGREFTSQVVQCPLP